jgi:cardiolipin synthase
MEILSPKELKSFRSGNKASLIRGGPEYFELLERLIREARETIHLQVFIISEDETGSRIGKALRDAAKRGVEVYVVVDTFGSRYLSLEYINNLVADGVKFRFFAPLFSSRGLHWGRRMHHKIFLADGKKALVGGINVADKYYGTPEEKAWLDFAVFVEGEICQDIMKVCLNVWKRRFSFKSLFKKKKFNTDGGVWARIRENDWMRGKNEISSSYKKLFQSAQRDITIVDGYFLPGNKLRRLLRRASDRGVEIRIILTNFSDVPMVKGSTTYLYDWLIRHGVEVYEWRKSVVHAKAVSIDSIWTSIGSHNINFLSEYGLMELNLEIYDKNFTENFNNYVDSLVREGCQKITKDQLRRKSFFERVVNWFSYRILVYSMRLSVFLTRKEYKEYEFIEE